MRLTAAVVREDESYVATCLEVDVASQGDTIEAAVANLAEALELYFEDHDRDVVRNAAPIYIAPVDVRLTA